MLSCCERELEVMQTLEGLWNFLEFCVKVSPYAVLVPELASGLMTEGTKEVVKGMIQDMAIEKALDKVTGADQLPGVEDAVKAVGEMKLRDLQNHARLHSIRNTGRHGGKETQFWEKLAAFYDPAKAGGNGGGWDLNPFW